MSQTHPVSEEFSEIQCCYFAPKEELAPELSDCFPGIEAEVIGEDEKFVRVEDIDFGRDEFAIVFSAGFDKDSLVAERIPEIFKIFDIASMDTISSVTFLQSSEPFL